jgi:CheY-like chemotaxis protein
VLVVDDVGEMVVFCVNMLQSLGYAVKGVVSGAAALELLDQESFDVAVVDYSMPELDGLRVVERGRQRRPDTAFVLLTGYGNAETVRRATGAGCASVLLKPFTRDELRGAMDQAMAHRAVRATP